MITLQAETNIYKGYAVSLSLISQQQVALTDWNNYESVAAVVGIAMQDVNGGQFVDIQQDGIFENPSWTFEYLKPVYVFAMGTLTQTLPPKNVIQIGRAISPTKLLIRISEFIQVSV
jgi:predicted RecA/RadA family phage recombinase